MLCVKSDGAGSWRGSTAHQCRLLLPVLDPGMWVVELLDWFETPLVVPWWRFFFPGSAAMAPRLCLLGELPMVPPQRWLPLAARRPGVRQALMPVR